MEVRFHVATRQEYLARDQELGVLYRTLLAAEHAAEMAGWNGLARMLRKRRRRVFIAQVMLAARTDEAPAVPDK
jgi:hypothetical protein